MSQLVPPPALESIATGGRSDAPPIPAPGSVPNAIPAGANGRVVDADRVREGERICAAAEHAEQRSADGRR